jgi:antitoxin MazE
MRAIVSKWGNSLGLRIPRSVAADIRLSEGSTLDVRAENGRLIAEPIDTPSLDELVARITPENRHGEQFDDAPRGREAW